VSDESRDGNLLLHPHRPPRDYAFIGRFDIVAMMHDTNDRDDDETGRAERFQEDLNTAFAEEGIGWELLKGEIVARGDQGFQEAIKTAASQLAENQRPTAANHIQSAFRALSERPKANTPGAVFHATNAVECVLHEITGESMTLSKYLDNFSGLFHLH
jgi:hypothetical protein